MFDHPLLRLRVVGSHAYLEPDLVAFQLHGMFHVVEIKSFAIIDGQADAANPFSTVETERWLGLSWDPMSSAVAVLINHNPRIPVHTLPVSWRLPATAAPVVSESFYPFTGFTSATSHSQRQLGWNTRPFGMNALDLALDTAAESGWALYEFPHRHTLRTEVGCRAA